MLPIRSKLRVFVPNICSYDDAVRFLSVSNKDAHKPCVGVGANYRAERHGMAS